MRLPEFTAEKSMVRTNWQTRRAANLIDSSAVAAITPQRIKLQTVHCNCDSASDICVCENGRVLHDVLGDL